MKNFIFALTGVFMSLLCSCSYESGQKLSDYDITVYEPAYASGFNLDSAENRQSILLTIKSPWQGADSTSISQLLILKNGKDAPDEFAGKILNGPAERIVAMSSTQIALLDAIGQADKVVGVSGLDFISNNSVRNRLDSSADVGYEGNVNYEKLVALEPDIVFLYGVSVASPMEGKLDELNIPYVYIGEYLEESPVGKAEWMIPVAEITGQRETGITTFASIPQKYDSLKNIVSDTASRPKVMLNLPYGDSWFLPPVSSYMVRLIEDAGGSYMFTENQSTSSVPVDFEQAYSMVFDADFWLNTGSMTSLNELTARFPRFADAPCVKERRVYNNNARTTAGGGNDFYESAVTAPDMVLRDLIHIFHPELADSADLIYYRKL